MPQARVAGRRVYYEVHGSGPDPPLLLVMGMGGSCRGWNALQVPEFSKHRRTIVYDHRGVSESEDPGGPFTTADLADDAAGLLDALNVESADVLGAFMGGMAAQELALRHPERVDRLVLVGTYARPDAKRRMLLGKWREMILADVSFEILVQERLLWTLSDATLEQDDLIDAMTHFFLRERIPISREVWAKQCDACLRHDTHDRLPEVRQRALVLCGQQDQLTPLPFHRTLATALADAHLVTIPTAAHLVMVETAERFNEAVLQFLAEDR